MLNLNFVTPKRHFLASYEQSCVKISSVVPVEDGKKKKKTEGKGRKGKAQKVTQALYFTYSWASPS